MADQNKLPEKAATQNAIVQTEQPGSLVARGLEAIRQKTPAQKQKSEAPTLEERLVAAQHDYETWMLVATKPEMSTAACAWALGMARSAKAEIDLLRKAMVYQRDSEEDEAARQRSQDSLSLNAELDLIVPPNKLTKELDYYTSKVTTLLQLPVNPRDTYPEIVEHSLQFPLDDFFRLLKGTHTNSLYSYCGKLGPDHRGSMGTIHHGYYFTYFAVYDKKRKNVLEAIRFDKSIDGVISAFFVDVILPQVGVFWHGSYYVEIFDPIESYDEINNLLSETSPYQYDIKKSTLTAERISTIPLGIRVKKGMRELLCACLGRDDKGSIIDYRLVLDENGRIIRRDTLTLSSTAKVFC